MVARGVRTKSEERRQRYLPVDHADALLAALVWIGFGLRRGLTAPSDKGLLWSAIAGGLSILIGRIFYHSTARWLGAVRGSSVKRIAPFFHSAGHVDFRRAFGLATGRRNGNDLRRLRATALESFEIRSEVSPRFSRVSQTRLYI